MKTKFLLPIIAMSLLVACDDSSSASTTGEEPTSSAAEEPTSSAVEEQSSSSEAAVPGEESSSSSEVAKTYKYYGAELTGKEQFTYGRFEARMKMASFPGTVTSMFLNYDLSWKKGTEPWNEIDIEVLGTSKEKWQSNIITREADPSIPGTTVTEKKHDFGFDATADFHLYGIVWTPDYVAWEIDSVEVRRVETGVKNGSHADADQVAFLTEKESLRFNFWASQTPAWTGKFTGEELADGPQIQWIDYVRVYSYDTENKTFTQSWQDDFDGASLDMTRWSKGNWEMELTTHSPNNVVVEDGYCKLLMTRVEQ